MTYSASIKDVLNVRKKDFFVSYGMGPEARVTVEHMRHQADVSSGIALDAIEFEECCDMRTVVYRGFDECPAKQVFDKVYCNFSEFPHSMKDLRRALNVCYDLCATNGLVLLAGVEGRDKIISLIQAQKITKYWFISERGKRFDLLFKKEDANA